MSQPIEFIPNAGACLATTNVLSRRGQVRWVVRESPQNPTDSGWRVVSDVDTDEDLSQRDTWRIVDYNDVCTIEPALVDIWGLPVGSDLQLVRDHTGLHLVDTATGRRAFPDPTDAPAHPTKLGPNEAAHRVQVEREQEVVDATFDSLRATAGWDLALVTITFTDNAQPAHSCLLYATGDDEPNLAPWFASHALPTLPFVGEAGLPPAVIDRAFGHRQAMPDESGRLWSSMQCALERDGEFSFYHCRYR